MRHRDKPQTSIVIIGGGPAGYEAALVAAQLGAQVTLVESDGLGGACVLSDCVPSKTLIATSETMVLLRGWPASASRSGRTRRNVPGAGGRGGGPGLAGRAGERDSVDAPRFYRRVKDLARRSPRTSGPGWPPRGSRLSRGGAGCPADPPGPAGGAHAVVVGDRETVADVVLIATGATPRVLPSAEPDGERILTWRQVYDLDRAARAPDRGRLGRDRRRVRQRLPGDGRAGDAGVQPGPGAAGARTPTRPW